jgi:hypothetical protein
LPFAFRLSLSLRSSLSFDRKCRQFGTCTWDVDMWA